MYANSISSLLSLIMTEVRSKRPAFSPIFFTAICFKNPLLIEISHRIINFRSTRTIIFVGELSSGHFLSRGFLRAWLRSPWILFWASFLLMKMALVGDVILCLALLADLTVSGTLSSISFVRLATEFAVVNNTGVWLVRRRFECVDIAWFVVLICHGLHLQFSRFGCSEAIKTLIQG